MLCNKHATNHYRVHHLLLILSVFEAVFMFAKKEIEDGCKWCMSHVFYT